MWSSQSPIFEKLIPAILKWEGGSKLVDHPRDPGGKTKYGISERYNAGALQELNTTIKTLSEEDARKIYFKYYFQKSGCEELDDSGLVLIHFDAAINHGVGAASKILKALPANPAYYAGNGLNKAIFNELSIAYIAQRQRRYADDPNADVFLEGWVNRLARLLEAHVQLQFNPNADLK